MLKLKKKRQAKGYSCQYMANKLDMSKSFYWQLENYKRRLAYDTAVEIANIFNSKPDDIFYEDFKNGICHF